MMEVEFNPDAWYAIWNGGHFTGTCPQALGERHWFVRVSKRSWKTMWRKRTIIWCCYCGTNTKL